MSFIYDGTWHYIIILVIKHASKVYVLPVGTYFHTKYIIFSTNFVLLTPTVLRYDVEEYVVIDLEEAGGQQDINIYLTDYPLQTKRFSEINIDAPANNGK